MRHREGQLADNTDIARDTEMGLGDGGACQAGGENQTAEGEENVGGRKGPYTKYQTLSFLAQSDLKLASFTEISRPRNSLDLNHMDPHPHRS